MNRYDDPSDEGTGLEFDHIGFMARNPGTHGIPFVPSRTPLP